MNTYTVSYTDNIVSGTQAVANVTAEHFTFAGNFVVFTDTAGQVIFAVPTDRDPIITLTGVTS